LPKLRCFQLIIALPSTLSGGSGRVGVARLALARRLRATAAAGVLTVAFALPLEGAADANGSEGADEREFELGLALPAELDVDACCACALAGCVTVRAPYVRLTSPATARYEAAGDDGSAAGPRTVAVRRPAPSSVLRPRELAALACRFCDASAGRWATSSRAQRLSDARI